MEVSWRGIDSRSSKIWTLSRSFNNRHESSLWDRVTFKTGPEDLTRHLDPCAHNRCAGTSELRWLYQKIEIWPKMGRVCESQDEQSWGAVSSRLKRFALLRRPSTFMNPLAPGNRLRRMVRARRKRARCWKEWNCGLPLDHQTLPSLAEIDS